MKIGEVEIFEEKCLDAVDWPKYQAPSENENWKYHNFRGEMSNWPKK